MTQTQQLTDEELRDEILAIFEEHEQELIDFESKIKKIEDDARDLLDRKIISIKNKMVEDLSIPDDNLEQAILDEIKRVGEEINLELIRKTDELLKKATNQ